MIDADSHRRPLLRTILAAVIVVDLGSFLFFLGDARTNALASGTGLGGFSNLVSQSSVSLLLVAGGVIGAVAFALRPGRLWIGLVPLGALTLLSSAHAQLFGSPWRHLFYSGLCLSGWLLGLAVGRSRDTPGDEGFARVGATALLGAAYFNAGISKVVFGGSDWLSGLPIQAAVVAQDGLVADGVLSAYRVWTVSTPVAAILFSVLTVGFELAGPLMIVGRRLRLPVALGLFAMHFNILLLTSHILYWESMVLLLSFGLAADEPGWRSTPSHAVVRPRGRLFAGAVAVLLLAAAVAIGHQAGRYARTQEAIAAAATVAVVPTAVPTPAPLQQLGPFRVGDALGGGWSVDSLTRRDASIVVAVSGAAGLARFEITCAPSEHRSPFDLGPAHIFYSNDLQYGDLEIPGLAIQERLRSATADQDACAAVASWVRG